MATGQVEVFVSAGFDEVVVGGLELLLNALLCEKG